MKLNFKMLNKFSINYERIYLAYGLPNVETLLGNIACLKIWFFFQSAQKKIKEQIYLWLKLNCLNSTSECQFTILKSSADNKLFKQLFKWTFGLNKFICLTHGIRNSYKRWKGEPKNIKNLKLGTLGYPKSCKGYGYGVYRSTRLLFFNNKYVPSNVGRRGRITEFYWLFIRSYSVESQPKNITNKLNNIVEISNKYSQNKLNVKLYSLLYDKELYYIAYNHLKNKKNTTSTLEYNTFEGISDDWINETIKSLKNESFQFKPTKKIRIFKKKVFVFYL